MKAGELLKMTIKELEEREVELWKEWETTRSVLKVVRRLREEE
jgi:hypothetical protein